jgi:ankyrin repeat protein
MDVDSSLVLAVKAADPAAVRTALAAGADPNARYGYEESWDGEPMAGQESVLQLAARGGHAEITGELLSGGADPDLGDTLRGRSPLVEAAARGDLSMVAMLLAAGATVGADPERAGRDVLAAAIEHGHAEVARALVRAGARATPRALELACHRASPELIELCTGHGAPLAAAATLVTAARSGDVATLRWLVEHGADLVAEGGEALCEAANAGRHDAAAFLLALGVSPACRNAYGWPPLHFAAYQSDAALCELLLRAGADPSAADPASRTAADWAGEAGRGENVAAIERALRAN